MKLISLLAATSLSAVALAQMPGRPIPMVQVEKASVGKDKLTRKSIGHVEAERTVNVKSAVEGFLLEAPFEEGSMVKAGDVIFRIDPLRYEAAVKQAEAAIRELDAQIVYAEKKSKRLSTLAKSQATSKQDQETALASLAQLKAQREGAEAALTKARKDLDDCTIRAEISGCIGRKDFSVGNYITAGEQLVSIKQMDPIYLRFPLSQSDVNSIFRGPKEIANVADVRLILASGQRYPQQGKIRIVDNLLSGETDTYSLWAEFDNKENILSPQGIGALIVSLNDTAMVTMVPLTAVQHDADSAFVYTVDEEGRVSRRDVIAGSVQGRMQSIYEGLNEGEVVITDGAHKTRVGAKVRPVLKEEEAKAEAKNTATPAKAEPLHLQTVEVSESSDPTVISCQGARIEAINRIELRPLVQGLLESKSFKEGDLVHKDELLFSIDPTRYKAAVEIQKAALAQLAVRIEDAEAKLERQRKLSSANATSADDLESAEAVLNELLAQKSKEEAALSIAEDDVSRCQIHAAMDARIGRVMVSRGNYISNLKEPLATLLQVSPIYVRFSLSENHILSAFRSSDQLKKDACISLLTATGKRYGEEGSIAFCDNVVQSDTDTQNIWAVFENKDKSLRPGGVVTVQLRRKPDIAMPALPADLVLTDTIGRYVYVLENGHARLTRILCGATTEDGRIIVYQGLEKGMKVISSGLADLTDGCPVISD